MPEITPTAETERSPEAQAYSFLLQVKERQLEELERLQGKPEEFELYLADRHTIYDNLIKEEAKENPLIWKIHQRHKRNDPSKLEIPQARAKRITTPEQREELGAKAYQRKIYQRIWDTIIDPNFDGEDKEKLRKAIDDQLGSPLFIDSEDK